MLSLSKNDSFIFVLPAQKTTFCLCLIGMLVFLDIFQDCKVWISYKL